MERKSIDKQLQGVICHEWGHILAFVVFGGNPADVEGIVIENSLQVCNGHTNFNPLAPMEPKQEINMILGGIAAENICGYSRAFLHPGTDANRLDTLTTKEQQKTAKNRVLEVLTPYKTALDELTAATIEDYRREGCPEYFRVFKDVVIKRLAPYFEDEEPPEGCGYYDQVEQLLGILKRNYEDAAPLVELPPLPFTKGFAEKARENDLGVYVAVGDEQFTSLVKFFLRACRIEGKYYYYTAKDC